MFLGLQEKALLADNKPFEALVWRLEEGGLLCVAIKVPLHTAPNSFSLLFEDLILDNGEEAQLILRYSVISSAIPVPYKLDLTYRFDLSNEEHQSIVDRLRQTESIYIHCLMLGRKKKRYWTYEGRIMYSWSKEMREKVHKIMRNDQDLEIVQQVRNAADIVEQRLTEQKSRGSILGSLQKILWEAPRGAILLNYFSGFRGPCLVVKVPSNTQVENISLTIHSLSICWYPDAELSVVPVAILQLTLWDSSCQYMQFDILFDSPKEREKLQLLSHTTLLNILFVTNDADLSILGAQRVFWRLELREQAKKTYREAKHVSSRDHWLRGSTFYQKAYPAMKEFQKSQGEIDVGVKEITEPISMDLIDQKQLSVHDYEEDIIPGDPGEESANYIEQVGENPKLLSDQQNLSAQSEAREQFHLMLSKDSAFSLIERCILKFRQDASNDKPSWSLLLAAGLEHARLFTWEKEALALLEQKRQTLSKSQRPLISPPFPTPYVWFEFAQPLETPICKDTAAIYLFSVNSDVLYRSSAVKSLPEPEFTQWKRKSVEGSERERLSILVIDTQGDPVWSMSLPITYDEGLKHEQRPWLTPPWYSCPQRRCKMFSEQKKDGTSSLYWELCPTCKEAQIFFSTWVMTAWQALLGEYRTIPEREEILDTIGTRQAENKSVMEGYAWLRTGRVRTYTRLITYKDISQALKSWHDVLHPRGSWVEALMKIDPKLVAKKKQAVTEHVRVLRSDRYKEPGKEILIKSFTRTSPVRADLVDVPRETKLMAKGNKEKAKRRGRR